MQRKPLHILALGDSLTAGYHNYGASHHPYATHLTKLFESTNTPVEINEQGVDGERVVPAMAKRLGRLLEKDAFYDWVIILGGTNDLGNDISAEKIFKEGLKPMYKMCLNHKQSKIKLVAMTVIENTFNSPTCERDQNRQALNTMIRDYVAKTNDHNRVFLVDLDKGIPYHSVNDIQERRQIWNDALHLTPAGYDRMATLIFDEIKDKL
ncbi:unnamed protein product [Rotaria sp. Silwood2]|nr:unnamed protein product [Rotaria sp. Silwood2]CAF3011544.1 unnamed protein product [Rotaria sp. Silwood2]CAF4333263.1 unnamed protein product [Rotaria sp. Silwood2]CAF4381992.1 unnamed protein product [Rotaria sp. Silwood2]